MEKEVRLHHQRPKNRGIGHAVNDLIQAGAVDMGQFFSYMCISGGQRFSGVIRGKCPEICRPLPPPGETQLDPEAGPLPHRGVWKRQNTPVPGRERTAGGQVRPVGAVAVVSHGFRR